MDARRTHVAAATNSRILVAVLVWTLTVICVSQTASAQRQFRSSTRNFVVSAPDQQLATQAAQLAEQYRQELAVEWLGHELPPWKEKCPVQIEIGPHAGGETSFAFVDGRKSEPVGWQMRVFGPPNRILDSVLPHEVTHTIFATHFGQPLPRWADEGACTTVEHQSERAKNHQLLMQFLTSKPSRGIPFNRMFTMKQYPGDILPLYAQGYSVAKFLIAIKGRQAFIKYIEDGLEREAFRPGHPQIWDEVTRAHYGFENLSDLQVKWLTGVKAGGDINSAVAMLPGSGAGSDSPATFTAGPLQAAAPSSSSLQTAMADGAMSDGADHVSEHVGSWYLRQSRGAQTPATAQPHVQRHAGGDTVWR